MERVRPNYKEIIVVPGNHDWYVYNNPNLAKELFKEKDIKLLIDETIEIEGITFYGHPWTPMFCNWAYMLYEDEMREKCANIPQHDVLLSHGPPHGFLDAVEGYDKVLQELGIRYTGCKAQLDLIERIQPSYNIYGHIHEGYGRDTYGKTKLCNVAHMDKRYKGRNKPITLEI